MQTTAIFGELTWEYCQLWHDNFQLAECMHQPLPLQKAKSAVVIKDVYWKEPLFPKDRNQSRVGILKRRSKICSSTNHEIKISVHIHIMKRINTFFLYIHIVKKDEGINLKTLVHKTEMSYKGWQNNSYQVDPTSTNFFFLAVGVFSERRD